MSEVFETFCDYLYSLLYTPLRRVKQSSNQFYRFFKTDGKLFDSIKSDIFKAREESMVLTASEAMLAEHGRDRNLPRLANETADDYSRRLYMKTLLAEKAGTKAGLALCILALGHKGEIVPYYMTEPERWAEFLVRIRYDLNNNKVININNIKNQVRSIKPASAKDNYLFVFFAGYGVPVKYGTGVYFFSSFHAVGAAYWRLNARRTLDGTWKLDRFGGRVEFYPMGLTVRLGVEVSPKTEGWLANYNYLDSAWGLDGTGQLNGSITSL